MWYSFPYMISRIEHGQGGSTDNKTARLEVTNTKRDHATVIVRHSLVHAWNIHRSQEREQPFTPLVILLAS